VGWSLVISTPTRSLGAWSEYRLAILAQPFRWKRRAIPSRRDGRHRRSPSQDRFDTLKDGVFETSISPGRCPRPT
jgi:hypothetical protein